MRNPRNAAGRMRLRAIHNIHNEDSSAMVLDARKGNNGRRNATDDFKKSLYFLRHSTRARSAWRA
jgi:hypothetical protein